MGKVTKELLDRAIAGDRKAVDEVFRIVTPVLLVRACRVLRRRGVTQSGDLVTSAEEVIQNVFVKLVENDWEGARDWDPARGLSFENFAGLIAEQTASKSLIKRKEELLLDPDPCEVDEPAVEQSRTPEAQLQTKETLGEIFHRARSRLTELGRRLLDLLFVERYEAAEVASMMNMTLATVYQWRSRILRLLQDIAREIEGAE